MARALVVAIFVALALGSGLRTWADTWHAFGDERTALASQAPERPLALAERVAGVDPRVLDFYAVLLRAGDRYAFQVPPEMPSSSYQALLLISALALLPALRVEDLGHADVLLSYAADPRALNLAPASWQYGNLPYFVTRLGA
jgi:hypothetical protein